MRWTLIKSATTRCKHSNKTLNFLQSVVEYGSVEPVIRKQKKAGFTRYLHSHFPPEVTLRADVVIFHEVLGLAPPQILEVLVPRSFNQMLGNFFS